MKRLILFAWLMVAAVAAQATTSNWYIVQYNTNTAAVNPTTFRLPGNYLSSTNTHPGPGNTRVWSSGDGTNAYWGVDAGSQSPWTADVNGAGYSLTNAVLGADVSVTTGAKLGYVDRGDPLAYDYYSAVQLITDGTWRDLNLNTNASINLPTNVVAVSLYVSVTDNLVNKSIQFRPNGYTNTVNRAVVVTVVASQTMWGDIIIACDKNGIIEYLASNTTFDDITLAVKGWFYGP